MTERESTMPKHFNLVEVENPDFKGLVLNRKVGQGIYIQKFGTIKITGIDSDYLRFSIDGFGERGKSLPSEDHQLEWDHLYNFEGTSYFIKPLGHSVNMKWSKILLAAPWEIDIVREELLFEPSADNEIVPTGKPPYERTVVIPKLNGYFTSEFGHRRDIVKASIVKLTLIPIGNNAIKISGPDKKTVEEFLEGFRDKDRHFNPTRDAYHRRTELTDNPKKRKF